MFDAFFTILIEKGAMRKFLSIVGAISLIVLVLAGVALGVVAYKGHALDVESKAFVDDAVPAIVTSWSKEQLLDRATTELRANAKPDQLAIFFDRLSRLGALVHYDGATGAATMSYFTFSGSTVSATYVANAEFQNGQASFKITLLKRDGQWLIHNFHVDPVAGKDPRPAL